MDPRRVHLFDQSTGASAEWAAKLAAYYRALLAEGFSASDALALTRDYQAEVIRSIDDWSKKTNGR